MSSDFSFDVIDREVEALLARGEKPTSLYVSVDLYCSLLKSISDISKSTYYNTQYGPTLSQIWTSAGPLSINRVPCLHNFWHVGDAHSYKYLEDMYLMSELEKAILKDEEEK